MEDNIESATIGYEYILKLLKRLGLNISIKIPATSKHTWLGFQIDTMEMMVTIPLEKMTEILTECSTWKGRTHASRKDLQKLVGRLKHISKCIPQSNTFFSRLLASLRAAPCTGKHKLNSDFQKDIDWFIQFASNFNGICMLPTKPKQQ